MQVEEELSRLSAKRDALVTIGVFDGVHLGHKYLISRLIEQAGQQNLLSVVVTFGQHPQEVVPPGAGLPLLTDLAERESLLRNEGVDAVVALSFTEELSRLSAREFVSLLREHLSMRGLVAGPDFALGKGREGDIDTLRKLGQEMDFSVTVVPPLVVNGEVVSSTAIRQALADGDVEKFDQLAGRPFSLQGRVVAGAGRGADLGFPTANLDINQGQALPADGVYASLACVDGKTYPSMTNIGQRPTFGGGERNAEVYIVDYHGDLYGSKLKVDIIQRVRDEMRFDNIEELKKQVAEDVARGRAILNTRGGNRA